MMKKILLIFCFFNILFFSNVAYAHPHGWLEVKADFVFVKELIQEIHVEWIVDELNSMINLEVVDKNKNDKIEPDEQILFKKQILSFFLKNMKEKHYFSTLRINGNIYKELQIKNFTASVKAGQIVLNFTILPKQLLDPKTSNISFSFYDETYYYDVYFDEENPIKFIGNPPLNCTYKIQEDPINTYYYGVINPQEVKIICNE